MSWTNLFSGHTNICPKSIAKPVSKQCCALLVAKGCHFFYFVGKIGNKKWLAYADYCHQDDELDRPVAIHTNICPKRIAKSVSQNYSAMVVAKDCQFCHKL
jgi:hypothetical protein